MKSLPLSIAVGNYDRIRPLFDGDVPISGVDPRFLCLEPEEIFFRAIRHAEFDVCELSLSSYTASVANGTARYVALPVFPSRAFRHTAFYVREDSPIDTLQDLRGRRIGLPEYQLTACVWARILMADAGVPANAVSWVRGGLETPGRPEKARLSLPDDISLVDAPFDRTLSDMLVDGEIDAIVSPRPPRCMATGQARWLFSDTVGAAQDYFTRTGIFPIMHVLAVRRDVYEANRWLPSSLLKAFVRAKDIAVARLDDNAATKATLPFVEERVAQARELLGRDYWSYGLAANRSQLDHFARCHHEQGISARRVGVDELFAPESVELYAI